MEPGIRRTDLPQPVDAILLMQHGRLLLQALTSEAHAARVDVKRAELEMALTNAEAGDASSLTQWLASYQSTNKGVVDSLRTSAPFGSSIAALGPAEEAGAEAKAVVGIGLNAGSPAALAAVPRTWETFSPHSRQRLQVIRDGLRDSRTPLHSELETPTAPSASDQPTTAGVTQTKEFETQVGNQVSDQSSSIAPQFGAKKLGVKSKPTSSAATLAARKKSPQPTIDPRDRKPNSKFALETADLAKASHKSSPPVPKQELLTIAKAFDAAQAEEQTQKHRKFLLLSGVSGFGASLFVHLLVVIALMIITLKLPATTASLVFEASSTEALEDTVELTQPTEITTAEDTPESPSEVVTDPTESLAEISALTSASLSEATPAQTSSLSNLAAAASAAASGGKPNPANANASFFGASASGNCFCYVIDGSESMRGGPWEAAKAELLRSLATLKENQRFYIVFFNKELSAISMPGEREPAPRPLYATKENLNHARGWIETLRIAPGAPPNKALKLAIEREPDAIYLLTDGDTKVDVAEFLRNNNRTTDFVNGEQVMVPIHAIAFYSRLGEELMKRIATENKGQFIYIPKPEQR